MAWVSPWVTSPLVPGWVAPCGVQGAWGVHQLWVQPWGAHSAWGAAVAAAPQLGCLWGSLTRRDPWPGERSTSQWCSPQVRRVWCCLGTHLSCFLPNWPGCFHALDPGPHRPPSALEQLCLSRMLLLQAGSRAGSRFSLLLLRLKNDYYSCRADPKHGPFSLDVR